MTGAVGVVTSSWPTDGVPWAGHFVADQAAHLARLGHAVTVVAPRMRGEGPPHGRPGVRVVAAPVPIRRTSTALVSRVAAWPVVMAALAAGVRRVRPRPAIWLAHWWPTALAVPPSTPVVAALHGSDVDLLERLPAAVARWLSGRARIVAVAPQLAERFARRAAGPTPPVLALGARPPSPEDAPPGFARWWLESSRPRVLTVARPAAGKGLEVARAAAARLPAVAWLVAPPEGHTLRPGQVRALMAAADLCVVPSEEGRGLPREGRPHVIAQALVAGVPVIGGPNRAVRQAVRELGQVEVTTAGPDALAAAVRSALAGSHYDTLARAATDAGRSLSWEAVIPAWSAVLSAS